MSNYVVTYNVHNHAVRIDVVKQIEDILSSLGLIKQNTNQSTFYGDGDSKSFISDLHAELIAITWDKDDAVTVYYPIISTDKVGVEYPDIKEKEVKSKNKYMLNFIV
ncbi:MAG: hypothetical protein CVU05_01995 [Bacteroidetes bacterium HGW-Bacteroidetes-21]|jgi:hypothetical protein|nr:MAG: hypothetical protein CVU05_01995 [Bacteroidetes bacterium HGW-Bacteroidetes-21]